MSAGTLAVTAQHTLGNEVSSTAARWMLSIYLKAGTSEMRDSPSLSRGPWSFASAEPVAANTSDFFPHTHSAPPQTLPRVLADAH